MMDNDEKFFTFTFIAILAVNLLVLGVGVWAVIELVQWVTSK